MKVILKRNMKSAKFNVSYPKGVELKYSQGLKAVEHPNEPNLLMRVEADDFTVVKPEYGKELKHLTDHDKAYIQTHAAYGKDFKTIQAGTRTNTKPTEYKEERDLYIRFAIDNKEYFLQEFMK